ncbi:MAG TPA: 2-amino-4-hydroxy-6-hydroxymethyldihydropteridine diphosphokinase [Anaerolineales bacterium]|nr:2-amino-4-hydroxy-6-hydroxymethyldihydropteridine diphosphokinase [Anaerolineales bacterium]
MNMDHIVYLSLGTNIGNRPANLKQALSSLPPQMTVKKKSKVYETPPWGYTEQDNFLNQAVKVSTYLEPEPLLKHIKRLEVALGRKSTFRHGPRLIDIDILFYDEEILETSSLVIPHPHLHERGFVLMPLMDIAPDLVHPVQKKKIRELMGSSNTNGIKQFGK